MKTKGKYAVAFTGLASGVHSFAYQIDSTFFEDKEYSPIREGDIDVELELEKHERFFVLNFRYGGNVLVQCDRCMADIKLPLNGVASLLVKVSPESDEIEDDDEVMYIHPNDISIDFSQFLYENIVVDIPLYKTCEDDVRGQEICDQEILSILEQENDQQESEKTTDPRWEQLKKIKTDNYGTSEE